MFNRKKIEELELRIWALENPCKFKVGEKVTEGGIVIETEAKYDWIDGRHWNITFFTNNKQYTFPQRYCMDLKLKTNKNK